MLTHGEKLVDDWASEKFISGMWTRDNKRKIARGCASLRLIQELGDIPCFREDRPRSIAGAAGQQRLAQYAVLRLNAIRHPGHSAFS